MYREGGNYHESQGIANRPPVSMWKKVNRFAVVFSETKAFLNTLLSPVLRASVSPVWIVKQGYLY